VTSKKFQSASSRVKKEAFVQQQLQKAAHHDDPVLLELEQQCLGKLLFDFEAPKKNRKTYRVTSIETYKHEGAWKYQATCVPVVKSNGGEWLVPQQDLVVLPDGQSSQDQVKNKSLFAVFLYDDTQEPKKLPYLDEYIESHEGREKSSASAAPPPAQTNKRRRR
jgi:hypothetical protein